MKFHVETKALLRAVSAASRAIASRNVIPVLECVLIRAEDNKLRVTGTNMDSEVVASCDAAVATAGELAVHAGDLHRFLSSLPTGSLTHAAFDGSRLVLTAGKSVAAIAFFPAADFPSFAVDAAPHEVPGAAEAFAFCEAFTSKEEARYYLCGVFFSARGTVATDRHRAGVSSVTSEIDAIVPTNMSRVIRPLLDGGGRLFLGPRVWRVEGDGVAAMGKLIDGTYPDWPRAMPVNQPMFTADADDVVAALRTATLDGTASRAFLSCGDGEITIRGDGHDRTAAEAGFRADIDVPFKGCVSSKYLQSALAPLSGTVIEAFGAGGSIGFRATGRPDWFTVCLGMQHVENEWPELRMRPA